MNPLSLVSGTWPSGPGEIIIDQATATRYHLRAGTTVGLVARKPLQRFRVTGIFRFAGATALGPTQFAAVDLAVAQRIFGKQGWFDEIDVAARPGVSVSQLVTAIRGIAPPTAAVNTAAQQARTATADVGGQFALLRYVLLAFGAIALFVGSFIIFNTLSITVAQRTRELATLRTLGASRRQVLASILAEGTIIGAISAVTGLGAGIGVAKRPQRPARRLRHPVARRRHRPHLADRRHQPHRRDRRHPRRQRRPGAAGHADRAHRRDPGGCGAASGIAAAPPHRDRRGGRPRCGHAGARGGPRRTFHDQPADAAGRRRAGAVHRRGRRVPLDHRAAGGGHREAGRAVHPRHRRTRPREHDGGIPPAPPRPRPPSPSASRSSPSSPSWPRECGPAPAPPSGSR